MCDQWYDPRDSDDVNMIGYMLMDHSPMANVTVKPPAHPPLAQSYVLHVVYLSPPGVREGAVKRLFHGQESCMCIADFVYNCHTIVIQMYTNMELTHEQAVRPS